MVETVTGYVFTPADLKVDERQPGISAFMRIRNGQDFLEATIRSHIDHFDEIVAVYNQCTDATPDILAQLVREYGAEKLRVFHYTDRVFPPGSTGHAHTGANDPSSMVNYSNFALAQTRFRTVTKLDDDHLAMETDLAGAVATIRRRGGTGAFLWAFAGLNLWRGANGDLTILAQDPISGSGDIGFFDAREDRFFTHDRRFERSPRAGLKRRFCGFFYWHLKYLKPEFGFTNYELETNPDSRYQRRLNRLEATGRGRSLAASIDALRPGARLRLASLVSDKHRFIFSRNAALANRFGHQSVEQALTGSVAPAYLHAAGLAADDAPA